MVKVIRVQTTFITNVSNADIFVFQFVTQRTMDKEKTTQYHRLAKGLLTNEK